MKIGKKLIISMLALTLVTMLLVYGGLYAIISDLRANIKEQYYGKNGVCETAKTELTKAEKSKAFDSLGALADMQAELTDSRLSIVEKTVGLSANFAEKLYASPSAYMNSPYSPVPLSRAPEDKLIASYLYSTGISETAELREELRLISNIEELFTQLTDQYGEYLDNLYVGTVSGIFYQYTSNNENPKSYVVTGRTWFKNSTSNPDEVMWKETEIDSYKRPCITASKAVRDAEGKVVAVVAADVNFEEMMKNVVASGIGKTGQSFVLGETRDLVAYSSLMKDADIEKRQLHNAFKDHFSDPEEALKKIEESLSGSEDVFEAEFEGVKIFMTARKIETTGWILCTAIDTVEIMEPVKNVEKLYSDSFDAASDIIDKGLNTLIINAILAIIAIALIIAVVVYFISRTISRPIVKLTDTVKNTGEGDFERKSDIDSRDEIGDLARGFNKMQDDLKLYTENLKAVTAEKERISAELNVATQIQTDMLPRIFPPFPQKKEIDLFASMTPAKEVGGDFYDFFLVDDNHLALVIADVSGKGVPAALFMVISKTLIKNRAMQGGTPAQILADVNNQLCEGNDADMFVTCWLGICDLSTGLITAASAGHEFPAVCGADRKFELFKDKHGFVLAAMEGARYRDYEIQLEKGGSIFVYTDGVPEATNESEDMFGTERMLEALNRRPDKAPEAFVKEIRSAVKEFTGEAPQFDDVTMAGMTWCGKDTDEVKQ